jgi:hypothetical protein
MEERRAPNRRASAPARVAIASVRASGEAVLCAALAAMASSLAVFAAPRGGDLAAHLYRTSLVQHGIVIWDNLWFAGQYPLASYSLLYYLLAAVVGNTALGVLGVVAASALFASIMQREWRRVGRWPARAFAVLLAGQAFTAAYPYDLGLAAMVGTLWALQRRRLRLAALLTLLTLGFSPLAFLFLVLALVALFLRRRRVNRPTLAMAAAATVAAGLQLGALVLLPTAGLVYPYGAWRFAAGLAVVGLGIVLCVRGRAGWPLASLFVVWAAASLVLYLVPTPVGHNLVRASVFLFPLMLIAASLADFRPRWIAYPALVGALAANVLPYVPMLAVRTSGAGSEPAFWAPVVRFLHEHLRAGYRVEVVPTANHWESDFLPGAGIPLARGWYRQLDLADDPSLYGPRLTPAAYRAWLRSRAVRFVVLPHLPLEAIDAAREARLLQRGTSGLRRVWSASTATIYALPHPTPLLTGPARAVITRLDANTIGGRVSQGGSYLLRVRFTQYWSVEPRTLCLEPAAHGMTTMTVARPGRFVLRALETPLAVLAANFDRDSHGCPPER